jgi:ankyrin repeat protein
MLKIEDLKRLNDQLIEASRVGNITKIKHLIDQGADIDQPDDYDITPLQKASLHNKSEAIITLIELGANVDKLNNDCKTSLQLAFFNNKTEAIETLIRHGANPNQVITLTSSDGIKNLTAIQLAILSSSLRNSSQSESIHQRTASGSTFFYVPIEDISIQKKIIQTLFDYGADTRCISDEFFTDYKFQLDEYGYIATHSHGPNIGQKKLIPEEIKEFIASLNTEESIAKRNQELKAKVNDINQREVNKQNLINAIKIADNEMIEKLVKENVSVNFFNELKQNPLLFALENNEQSEDMKMGVINILLKLKAIPSRSLNLAIETDKAELIEDLLKLGADIKITYGGQDLIQIATKKNSTKSISKLVELGFDINKKYKNEITLLHDAVSNGNIEAVKTLIELKADLNLQNSVLETPLCLASEKGLTEMVKLLVEAGANLNELDLHDETPLHKIIFRNDIESFKTLLFAGASIDKFKIMNYTKIFLNCLEGITPDELDEVEKEPQKLKKIKETGVYALLKIVNLRCDAEFTQEQKKSFEQKKQVFLSRIFSPGQSDIVQQEDGAIAQNNPAEFQPEFLKFPPVINIIKSEKLSAENKLKIIMAIAENPEQFKKPLREINKIKTSAKNPTFSSSISKDNQKLILKNLISDSDFFKSSGNLNYEPLLDILVDIFLELPSSKIKPNLEKTSLGNQSSKISIPSLLA